jgi:hypothetical protein
MTNRNVHGLSRTIPDDIKEQIRSDCGYGCVLCGNLPYEYEHIDPEFKDSIEHDPSRMALLCPTCHSKVTKGIYSKVQVKNSRAKPFCITNGTNAMGLDFSGTNIVFQIGNSIIRNAQFPLVFNGIPVFSAWRNPVSNSIVLNCHFYDYSNTLVVISPRNSSS